MAKTDLEIAQECVMEPIEKVAAKIGIPADSLEHYGKYKSQLLILPRLEKERVRQQLV